MTISKVEEEVLDLGGGVDDGDMFVLNSGPDMVEEDNEEWIFRNEKMRERNNKNGGN